MDLRPWNGYSRDGTCYDMLQANFIQQIRMMIRAPSLDISDITTI